LDVRKGSELREVREVREVNEIGAPSKVDKQLTAVRLLTGEKLLAMGSVALLEKVDVCP
jgi:hypothetical protein